LQEILLDRAIERFMTARTSTPRTVNYESAEVRGGGEQTKLGREFRQFNYENNNNTNHREKLAFAECKKGAGGARLELG
jgi:hypothetical protein